MNSLRVTVDKGNPPNPSSNQSSTSKENGPSWGATNRSPPLINNRGEPSSRREILGHSTRHGFQSKVEVVAVVVKRRRSCSSGSSRSLTSCCSSSSSSFLLPTFIMVDRRKLLQGWLYFVSSMRLFSVYVGLFDLEMFKDRIYSAASASEVTALHARTFALWTTVTCVLTAACASDLDNTGTPVSKPGPDPLTLTLSLFEPAALRRVTIFSFVVAAVGFTFEVFQFKTMSLADYSRTAPVAST